MTPLRQFHIACVCTMLCASCVKTQAQPSAPTNQATRSAAEQKLDAVTLRLTGVSALAGKKWAFVVRERRGEPPDYLTFKEGQVRGDVEVIGIDVENAEVTLRQDGKQLVLSMPGQAAAEREAQRAEKRFVEEHTRAHEVFQRRERERLARESAQNNH